MKDQQIEILAEKYRMAIEAAHRDGVFASDICFNHFPRGCCGDTCYLLAEYLRRENIATIWYSAQRKDWSHAWLVVKDKRVKDPTPRFFSWPEEIQTIIAGYGVEHPEEEVDITKYEAEDLIDGLIIDITADQFDDYNIPVYVGPIDTFHQTFDLIQAHDYVGLNNERLCSLFRIIAEYL